MAADSPSDPSGAFNPYATPKARIVAVADAPAEFALFLRWEKLRVLYNLILLTVVVLIVVVRGESQAALSDTNFLESLILYWLGANVCFCVGLVVNAYAQWLGLRHVGVTAALFVLGSLFSVFLAATFVLARLPRSF